VSYEGAPPTFRGFLIAVALAALLLLATVIWIVLAGPWRP
jgi:hypothetical protein